MKFRSAYDTGSGQFASPSGSRYRQLYIKKIYDGKEILEDAGKEDVFDSIQKAAPGNILEDLLRRARAGDSAAIPEPIDSYADISKAPKDLLEAHQMLLDARSKYDNLPADVKSVFGNDYVSFLEASANGNAVKVIQAKQANPDAKPLSSDEISKLRAMLGGNGNV